MMVKLGDPIRNARNWHGEKELIRCCNAVVYDASIDHWEEPFIARWYMGRSRNASRVHCSIWFFSPLGPHTGTAFAGGWGYDKQAAAFEAALQSANITIERSIGGFSCVRNAIREICEAQYSNVHLIDN